MAELGPEQLRQVGDVKCCARHGKTRRLICNHVATTHLLEQVMDPCSVVNNPVVVRNAPEKLLVTQFAGFMPPPGFPRDAESH